MDGTTAYRENAITTGSPGRLIVLLYEGAVRFLRKALEHMQAGQLAEAVQCIGRAKDIIQELNVSLDMEAGGEISKNLRSLYAFMIRHLAQADAKRDPQMIREVIKLLEDLNEGWKAICV